MIEVNGNILLWTDHHFGVKGNSPERQATGIKAMKALIDAAEKNNVTAAFFGGDYFHQRNQLSIDTINIAFKCLHALAKKCHVYMCIGNHDLFSKNSIDISSVNIFRNCPTITVIDKPTEMSVNGEKWLIVPWLSDLTAFKPESFDVLFGHFDISAKYLMSSYAEENRMTAKASEADVAESLSGIDPSSKSSDLVGSFVELCKRGGVVYAGHIHQHKEFMSKGRQFVFIGSPYQQTMGDIGCKCGYYLLDSSNRRKFVELSDLPRHIQLKMSDVFAAGIDKFDFSALKGNIVQRIYDVEIGTDLDTKIIQKMTDVKAAEELLPDYQVKLEFSVKTDEDANAIELLKTSKLEYIKSYIDNIDQATLSDEGISKDELYSVMEKYYKKATE